MKVSPLHQTEALIEKGADAKSQLGDIKSIREAFIGFQKLLYDDTVA